MIRPETALLRQTLWCMGFGVACAATPTPALARFVRHHGIAGLIDNARLHGQAPSTQAALAQERRAIALRALQLGATLKNLTCALGQHGLQPLALKGPTLALQAHGQLSARGGVDLDILLPEQQWPLALDVLAGQGYQPAPGKPCRCPPAPTNWCCCMPKGNPGWSCTGACYAASICSPTALVTLKPSTCKARPSPAWASPMACRT